MHIWSDASYKTGILFSVLSSQFYCRVVVSDIAKTKIMMMTQWHTFKLLGKDGVRWNSKRDGNDS